MQSKSRKAAARVGAFFLPFATILYYAEKVSDFFALLHLPKEMGDALVTLSQSAPGFVIAAVFVLGLICAIFLVVDEVRARRERKAKQLIGRLNGIASVNSDTSSIETINHETLSTQYNNQYAYLELNKVFVIGSIEKKLKLRFLPDTKSQSKDAAVLVLFGYKAVFGFGNVKSSILNQEIRRALHECPNRPNPLYWITGIHAALDNTDYGMALKDSGYAERNRLSEGGFLSLTKEGERLGLSLAYDAIRRA